MTFEKIWLSSPHMGHSEEKFVKDAFDTNWIAPIGPALTGFEKDLEEHLGHDVHVTALSSGTAAIHLALLILGVKADDEVICQSLTFVATANPIMYLGAKPVFIDSEEDTYNMCPHYLEEAIKDRMAKGKKPKAIIVVHLYGNAAKITEIMAISKRYDIPVIEDAAEALGSTYNNQPLGTFGDFGILSFNGNKIITTSSGGALVSKNEAWINKAKYYATQARDDAHYYLHSQVGYNYRMSNVCASIGRGQMQVLDQRVRQRRANFYFYKEHLNKYAGLHFLNEDDLLSFSNHWLSTALLKDISPDVIRLGLQKKNIESRLFWKPMHTQPVFQGFAFYGNGTADYLFKHGICFPSGSNLTPEQREFVLSSIEEILVKHEINVLNN